MATLTHTPSGGAGLGGEATVAFVSGAPSSVASDLVIEWDFDNDGDFSEDIEDITSYVLEGDYKTGRDWPSQLTGTATPGQLNLTLRNDDDRFNYFNSASPLTQGANSLRTGRKIRVRVAEAGNPDPTLLVRDRFDAADGALIADELGNPWVHVATPFPGNDFAANLTRVGGRAAAQSVDPDGVSHMAVIDTGDTSVYIQMQVTEIGRSTSGVADSFVGIVYRYQDETNYSAFIVGADTFYLYDVVAGATSLLDTASVEQRNNMTLGIYVSGTAVWAYLDGVYVLNETAIQTDETHAGILAIWNDALQPAPSVDNFRVWSGLPTKQTGVLWTGEVTEIEPRVEAGPQKTAIVKAEGILAKAAARETASPRFISQQGSGFMVGRVLSEAGLLVPPGGTTGLAGALTISPIEPGTVTMGPVSYGDDRGNVLSFARDFEETERGFLYETPEGYIGFDQATTRAAENRSSTPQAWFSDAAGTQLGYETIEPRSWQRDIVNQVTASVAPAIADPGVVSGAQASTAVGTPLNFSVTLPVSAGNGELFVLIVAASMQSNGTEWRCPLWWVSEREGQNDDEGRLRCYTHISDGSDGGVTYTFYTAVSGGAYTYYLFRFAAGDWFGVHEGIHTAEFQSKSTPPENVPPWGAEPTYYIAVRAGLGSASGASIGTTTAPYGYELENNDFANGTGSNLFDVGLQYAVNESNEPIEVPASSFTGFSGFLIYESTTIAIRGFNGTPPSPSERFKVTVDDLDSQDEHNAIRSHTNAAGHFRDVAEATEYCESVLAQHAQPRPIVTIGYTATKNADYRTEAKTRRVSDMVNLVADNNAGLGINGPFYVESIAGAFRDGVKTWTVTYELSPA